MKRWLKASLGLGFFLAAFAGLIYYEFFRSIEFEFDAEYAELKALGVPTSRGDYEKLQQGLTPIQDLVGTSKNFELHPSYTDFRMATLSPSSDPSQVSSPSLAKKAIADMGEEFEALRELIEASDKGYAYPLDLGGAPLMGASRDASAALVRRARAHLALGEINQAVDWSILNLRLARQLSKSKSQDAYWEGLHLGESSVRELTELLSAVSNDKDLVQLLLKETEEPMPNIDLLTGRGDALVSYRERASQVHPLREFREAFPNLDRMRQASVKQRIERTRTYLRREIGLHEAYRKLPKDLIEAEDAINNHPAFKDELFLRGRFKDFKDKNVRWALLRAGLLVLDYRLTHGRLPASESEIQLPMDCLTRQPLKYMVVPDGFIVYSPRADGDQGGLALPPSESWKPQDIVVRVKL